MLIAKQKVHVNTLKSRTLINGYDKLYSGSDIIL